MGNRLEGLPPFYHEDARILILGSFPSVKSREEGFYYAHPHNRFWKLLGWLYGERAPLTVEEKKDFLTRHGIALYDAAKSCVAEGSKDESLREIVETDLTPIFEKARIEKIFANGKKAEALVRKRGIPVVGLPSTSPRNARYSLEDLVRAWSVILLRKEEGNEHEKYSLEP